MRATSNDLNLRFHHLRHSFINITLLRLLSNKQPDLMLQKWCLDTDGSEILPNKHTKSILRLAKKIAPLGNCYTLLVFWQVTSTQKRLCILTSFVGLYIRKGTE